MNEANRTQTERVHNERCICGCKGINAVCEPCEKFIPNPQSKRDCVECGHWEKCHG